MLSVKPLLGSLTSPPEIWQEKEKGINCKPVKVAQRGAILLSLRGGQGKRAKSDVRYFLHFLPFGVLCLKCSVIKIYIIRNNEGVGFNVSSSDNHIKSDICNGWQICLKNCMKEFTFLTRFVIITC